jgi:hypothetical protein
MRNSYQNRHEQYFLEKKQLKQLRGDFQLFLMSFNINWDQLDNGQAVKLKEFLNKRLKESQPNFLQSIIVTELEFGLWISYRRDCPSNHIGRYI